MDPNIRAILQAGQRVRSDEAASRAAHAREARAAKLEASRSSRRVPSAESAQLAAIVCPNAGRILGILPPPASQTPLMALARLAFSPKVRGTGPEVDRARKLQHLGYALVGKATLERQEQGLQLWLHSDVSASACMRGLSAMWDEATQRSRGVLATASQHRLLARMRSQKLGEFMVVLASVMSCSHRANSLDEWTWQPWLCPPTVMASTKHSFLMDGLNRVLPVNFGDPSSLLAFACGARVAMLVFCMDFASSNIAAALRMQGAIKDLPQEGAPLVLHTERCLTHALHIVKSAALAVHSVASSLFSISKVVAHSRSMDGLVCAMKTHVADKLEVIHGAPPEGAQEELMAAIKLVLSIDGDARMIMTGGQQKRRTKRLREIEVMCQRSHFDRRRGKWQFFVEPSLFSNEPDREHMVSFILEPLLQVLVARRWEVASLNRWNGCIRCLKRLVLGCLLNGILPESLAGLSARLDLTEAKVGAMLEEHARRQAAGETQDDHQWLLHCKRVVRLSTFFRLPQRRWQMGAILLAASTVDRLHWAVTGFLGNPKLTLTTMVDPSTSRVASTMSEIRGLMASWRFEDQPWSLLKWLGLSALEGADTMLFCRGLLVSLSAGVFLHAERRFACWPYRLQHIISENTSAEHKAQVMREFRAASACCLGLFATRLRAIFPTAESMRTQEFAQALKVFESLLKFSTSPVENEHKVVKDNTFSLTVGTSIAPVCWQSVCRHLQSAHLQRGGADISVAASRSKVLASGTGPTLELPPAPPRAIADQPPSRNVPGADAQVEGIPMSDVAGGNPKVCFINYRTKKFAQARTGTTRDQINGVRAAAAAEYDRDPDTQARWTALFRLKQKKRKLAAVEQPEAGDGKEPLQMPVWGDTLQVPGEQSASPIAELVLKEVKNLFAPCPADLERLATDDSPFRAREPEDALPRPVGKLWGCGCELKNVCRRSLSLHNALRRFEHMQSALNRYIDSLRKPEVNAGRYVLLLSSDGPEPKAIWLLLAKAVYNPKVQVYVKCAPRGALLDADGLVPMCAPPLDLLMLSRPSRLSNGAAGDDAMRAVLHHETSEEVLQTMARLGHEWSVAEVTYRIKTDAGSLLEMVVEGVSEARPLRNQRPVNSGQDAMQRFLRMPQERPGAGARSAAGDPSSRADAGGPHGSEAEPIEDGEEGLFGFEQELMDAVLEDLGGPSDYADLEIEALMGEPAPGEDPGDEGSATDAEEEPAGPAAPSGAESSTSAANAQASSSGDVVAVADVAAAAIEGDLSPPDSVVIPPGSEVNDDETLWVTPLGYVYCKLPPFSPNRSLGLVSYQNEGKVLFANCHLHPHCNIRCGVVKEAVPRFRLAQWLALGTPCSDLPAPTRRERGKEHRARWARDGPFPA